MNLSAHDQKILDDMQKEFDEMVGEKPTHVFIDTKETINDGFISSPHDKFWDLLEVADDNKSLKRVCPKCGDDDCKYGLHDKAYSKCDVSILCNKCRHSEEASNPNYDEIINNWHKPV